MSDAPALVLDAVRRTFGRKVALDGVSFDLEPGTVLGLVGRNGAGKTTALRLAHGMIFPDAGDVRVLGLDPVTQGLEVRRRVSLLSEESSLYPWMRVGEILEFGAALHPAWDPALADELVRKLSLDQRPKIQTLSRGTKAQVALVLAIACRPELLLLDDPTAGLDPLVRREVLQGVLASVSEGGGAVVYASHLVHDVERIADRIVFLDDGRIGLEGSLDDIKARIRRARAVFDDAAPTSPELPGAIDWTVDGRVLEIVADATNGSFESSLRRLGAREIELSPLSLEDILVACLKKGGQREVPHA